MSRFKQHILSELKYNGELTIDGLINRLSKRYRSRYKPYIQPALDELVDDGIIVAEVSSYTQFTWYRLNY